MIRRGGSDDNLTQRPSFAHQSTDPVIPSTSSSPSTEARVRPPRVTYPQPRIDIGRRNAVPLSKQLKQFKRSWTPAQRSFAKLCLGLLALLVVKALVWDTKPITPPGQIAHPALLERITLGSPLSGQALDARKNPFLQSRIGRDDRDDLFSIDINRGLNDFWERFQTPFATNPETVHLDEQVIKSVVDELMSFNGWAAAACSSLTRPFGAHRTDDAYTDLTRSGQLYYFALVVHSADHFLIDQLAAVVQLGRRLGTANIFMSLVDYGSTDSTPFLCDMIEMVLKLLGISFRIRRIDPMTSDPTASYYPLEEAYTRNLALEPLWELYDRRKVRFAKVIWLKGFACPTDILETLRVSAVNEAAMTCSMDWKEHNGFFIYNDRWRTRDLDGNLFRGSKSTSPLDESPPRDPEATSRYALHLPFQVFCCESGVHIVDPSQSYYAGLTYRSSVEQGIFNISAAGDGKAPKWSEGPCMDSAQMHFCRDLWMVAAREGVKGEARRAKSRERSGHGRDLSDQYEEIVKAVVPQYAVPGAAGNLAGGGRKGLLGGGAEEFFDEEEDDDEPDGEDVDGIRMPIEGGPNDEGQPKAEAPAAAGAGGVGAGAGAPAVDKGVIAAADAAAAALPVEEQHAGIDLEDEERGVVDAAAARPPVAPPVQPAVEDDGAAQRLRKRAEGDPPQVRQARPGRPLPNSAFSPAKIIVNPRCVTTYAGVSHTQLALDLFGTGEDKEPAPHEGGKYALEEWRTAPETFVCQEMRTTGGRTAPKQQRRTGFFIARALVEGWQPTKK